MIVIFSVLPIILPCLTLFSTSVSSETGGKGNSLSSGSISHTTSTGSFCPTLESSA